MVIIKTMVTTLLGVVVFLGILTLSDGVDVGHVKRVAARNNLTCVLVFGDSSVDPGNNNYIHTAAKSNFPPYGKDFFAARPTGRFTDGRLATDFIADVLGYDKVISGYLEPNLTKLHMLHGVSFASAASGYDDLTANLSQVLTLREQEKYFVKYRNGLRKLVGEKEAEMIINGAVFLTSMGTNDFLQNYFLEPIRANQFTLVQYEDFLLSQMDRHIKVLHRLGARRVALVGVPPLGCFPLVKTLQDKPNGCVDTLNSIAFSFNSKLHKRLSLLEATLGIKTGFVDAFGVIQTAIDNPIQYGIRETSKGCCGTGTLEYGDTCKGMSTCENPSEYVFWDAVHPTQKIYKILADFALDTLVDTMFH